MSATPKCKLCHDESDPISLTGGVCIDCMRSVPHDPVPVVEDLLRRIAKLEALAKNPPLVMDPNPVKGCSQCQMFSQLWGKRCPDHRIKKETVR